MKHFYQSIQGYFTFEDLYREVAFRASLHEDRHWHGVEVGVYAGRSAAFLAVELMRNRVDAELDLVDYFHGGTEELVATLQPVQPVIGVIDTRGSIAAAKSYRNAELDFVFLDADHSYEGVTADIDAWLPKIRPGGILAGHDYVDHTTANGFVYGVKRAVAEKFDRYDVWRGSLFEGGGYWPSWLVRL